MATPARKGEWQCTHSIRRRIAFSDTNSASVGLEVGVIPAGSFVHAVIVNIETAFNAATTNVITVGTTASVAGLAQNAGVAAGVAGLKSGLLGSPQLNGNTATDMQVMVFYSQTGTAATAGVADVIVSFYPFAN